MIHTNMSPEQTSVTPPQLESEFVIGDLNRIDYLAWIFKVCGGVKVDHPKLSMLLLKRENDVVGSTFRNFEIRPVSNLGILIQLVASHQTLKDRVEHNIPAWVGQSRGGCKRDIPFLVFVGATTIMLEKRVFSCKPRVEIARLHEAFFLHRVGGYNDCTKNAKKIERNRVLGELIEEWQEQGIPINHPPVPYIVVRTL